MFDIKCIYTLSYKSSLKSLIIKLIFSYVGKSKYIMLTPGNFSRLSFISLNKVIFKSNKFPFLNIVLIISYANLSCINTLNDV